MTAYEMRISDWSSDVCSSDLPDEIEEPIVSKVEADAQPIIYLALFSDRHSSLEITDYADRYVKDRLQNLGGVADVRIFGERRYAIDRTSVVEGKRGSVRVNLAVRRFTKKKKHTSKKRH